MNKLNGRSFCLFVAFSGMMAVNNLSGDVIYQESGGRVVGEGEYYSWRTYEGAASNSWYVVPDESAGAGTFTNARNNAFIQSLPDNGIGGSPMVPPSVSYQMEIYTPGTYRLYLRWGCNISVGGGGNSDSIFVDIEELKDGTAGSYSSPSNQIPDWHELTGIGDAGDDFAVNPWRSWGAAEADVAGAAGRNADWVIPEAGIYTLRISQREDGSAMDAFVFQRTSLSVPTGDGPVMSSLQKTRYMTNAVHDTYIRRDNGTNPLQGTNTFMYVKNDTSIENSNLDRQTYLRFDISHLPDPPEGLSITNVALNIDLIDEGIGTNHQIYVAVIDEDATAEHFDELTLSTSVNSPSSNDVFTSANDEAVNQSKIYGGAPVGSFTISSSLQNKTITFSSRALLHAVQEDTDGVLSLVLYRTMDHSSTDRFASKEHETLRPPCLDVVYGNPIAGTVILIM